MSTEKKPTDKKAAPKKKAPKMDRKLVASKQPHEVNYFKTKFDIPASVTKEAIRQVGRSRVKVLDWLNKNNYLTAKQKIEAENDKY